MSGNLVETGLEKAAISLMGVAIGKMTHAMKTAPTVVRNTISGEGNAFYQRSVHCTPRNKNLMNIPAENLIIELFCKAGNLNNDAIGINNTFDDDDKLRLQDLLNTLKLSDNTGFKAFTEKDYNKMVDAASEALIASSGTIFVGNVAADMAKDNKGYFTTLKKAWNNRKLSKTEQNVIDKTTLDAESFVLSVLGVYAGKYFLAKFLQKLSEPDNKRFNFLKSSIIGINNQIFEKTNHLKTVVREYELNYNQEVKKYTDEKYMFYLSFATDIYTELMGEYRLSKEKYDIAIREYNSTQNVIGNKPVAPIEPSNQKKLFTINFYDGSIFREFPIKYNKSTRQLVEPTGYGNLKDALANTYKHDNPKLDELQLNKNIQKEIDNLNNIKTRLLDELERFVQDKYKTGTNKQDIVAAINEEISSSSLQNRYEPASDSRSRVSVSGRGHGGSIKNGKKHKHRKTSKIMRLK